MPAAVLLIYQPDGSVRDLNLSSEEITLGRANDCDIVIEGKLISRRHATISRAGQGYILTDLDSQNGTTINGVRLSAPEQLHDGDQIALGGMGKLVFSDSESTSSFLLPSVMGIWLDREKQDVWVDGQCLNPKLSPAQYKLLEVLNGKKDRICSRSEIIAAVWPDICEGVSDEAVDALIKRVRARLGELQKGNQYLVTFRSRGLMLKAAGK
jgi:DNA-binding response OmpR family regulator